MTHNDDYDDEFFEDDFWDWEEDFLPVEVHIPCKDIYIDEDSVKVVNIQEDMQGKDLLTFICPECGEEHTSYSLFYN